MFTISLELAAVKATLIGWWRGVVGNVFRLKRSYSAPDPVSTAIGDCLRAGTAVGTDMLPITTSTSDELFSRIKIHDFEKPNSDYKGFCCFFIFDIEKKWLEID